MKLINIVGARPNFMKIAPLMAAYGQYASIDPVLVHTGQHYDRRMSDLFFRQLEIPAPAVDLGVGSGSHAVQTAAIMKAFEPVVAEHKPDAVLVVGDVNSTIACGLVAVKLGIRLVHVEAGLRSFDRRMPEEINRVLTDAISDLLFCTEQSGADNLRREGVPGEKVFLVGNVMIDTLTRCRARADASPILEQLGLEAGRYAVLTLHRPSNVDDPEALAGILDILEKIQGSGADKWPIVFPAHPRTRKNLADFGLEPRIRQMPGLQLIDPVGYLEFLKLMSSARVVLTDSGGIQEETTILQVPCLTLRENTERPITVTAGSNRIVGADPERVVAAFREATADDAPKLPAPPLWDGHAAERVAKILAEKLS